MTNPIHSVDCVSKAQYVFYPLNVRIHYFQNMHFYLDLGRFLRVIADLFWESSAFLLASVEGEHTSLIFHTLTWNIII